MDVNYSCNLNSKRFDNITGRTWGVRFITGAGYVTAAGDLLTGSNGTVNAKAAQRRSNPALKLNTGGCNFLNQCDDKIGAQGSNGCGC